MPNSENNENGESEENGENEENSESDGIRSQMENDRQKEEELEEILREIGETLNDFSTRLKKIENTATQVVVEEVRQKADRIESKSGDIEKALIKLQSQGVPLEEKETYEETTRKLKKFLRVVGPATSLAEVRTELSEEWETKIEDLKKAWATNVKEIREDKKYRTSVTDDLKTSWWHVTKIVMASTGVGILLMSLTIYALTLYGMPTLPEGVRMTPKEIEMVKDGRTLQDITEGLDEEELERFQELWRKGTRKYAEQQQGQE